MNKQSKTARLEVRVTEEYKRRVEQAAYLRGQNTTEFVLNVLAEASLETIKNYSIIELTEKDRDCFVEELINTTSPTERAIADAQWYKETVNNNQSKQ